MILIIGKARTLPVNEYIKSRIEVSSSVGVIQTEQERGLS